MIKKGKVILLSTNNISALGKNNAGNIKWYPSKPFEVSMMWEPQHLHLISDDKIKKGDIELNEWYIHQTYGSKFLLQATVQDIENWKNGHIYGNKVIATTDPSLGLPGIPEEWIRDVYVPSNGFIKEVELEMRNTQEHTQSYSAIEMGEWKLKLINNEVCIVIDYLTELQKTLSDKEIAENYVLPIPTTPEEYAEGLEQFKKFRERKSAATEIFEIMKEMPEYKSLLENKELEDAAKSVCIAHTDNKPYAWTEESDEIAMDAFKSGVNWQKEKINEILEEAMMFAWQLGHKNVNWSNNKMINEFFIQRNNQQ